MLTLWDLLPTRRKARPPDGRSPSPSAGAVRRRRAAPRDASNSRYDAMTRRMLAAYGVRVRKWRSSMSGVAWQVTYEDGTVSRLIESPRPRGPVSCAIFLHEIGHHAIGFGTYRPRCLEEYHAWRFAIEQMEAQGLNVTARVRGRMDASLRYAVEKARRRGLKALPVELAPYCAGAVTERA
ncbi:MAG: hypothetical protein H6811_11645 [Phycisphaeraceae bacterium]|nr:hypothetical protein [Phycisphaeraceae bacterium]